MQIMLITSTAYPYIEYFAPHKGSTYPTDEEIVNLAIKKGVLPEDLNTLDVQKELEAGNSLVVWFITNRQDKVATIDMLKNMFELREKVVISKGSEYYVDEINGVLYNSLENGDIADFHKKGLGVIFKTIAIMDGDFDNGQDKVETFKQLLGNDALEVYRQKYPDRYQRVLEVRRETIEALGGKRE